MERLQQQQIVTWYKSISSHMYMLLVLPWLDCVHCSECPACTW